MSSKEGTSGGFFSSSNKRGEVSEWRTMLASQTESVRKDAVKKVIAAMTVGKDVSMLFPDMVKCVQTNNIELKKLVYLYIMNYSKTQPDLAILAVNTFVTDSRHQNALIRGLAVRTMGCIRVTKIVEYLTEPLRRCLKDKDPYVRKTAAVAIAKLFDLSPELAVDQGFIEALQELLTDDNPMVVANAVATLSEISANSPEVIADFTKKSFKTLLAALNECTEWGQIFILDSIANYEPADEREACMVADRVAPRLQHANSAVVLSAVKVIMKMLLSMQDETTSKTFLSKMASPLVTLLNSEPEIQYVALRNIDLIVQKYPNMLAKEIKMFFCKYNDPIYVKLEKLDIMIKLANSATIDMVLNEFKEYATEIDVEFVRKSVRAIGRCAIKLEKTAQKCIDSLLELIQTKVNYVVQEAIIVIKDIFRKYPNKYESIIGVLCENLDTLDEPEAKASMIWIIGEYAERIENADELLEVFIETFHDESPQVQLQLLTATVKLFLKRPSDTQDLVKRILGMCTDESDNPDLRDRGFIYWRLLSSDANAAKSVILAEKPTISDDSTNLEANLLNQLISYIATLSSIYHKPPELFVPDYKKRKEEALRLLQQQSEENQEKEEEQNYEIESIDAIEQGKVMTEDDILGLGMSTTTSSKPASAKPLADLDDILGVSSVPQSAPRQQHVAPTSPVIPISMPKNVILTADKGKGMQISGVIVRKNGQIYYDLTIENQSNAPMNGFAMKFNKNTFGLNPAGPIQIANLNPRESANTMLQLIPNGQRSDTVNNVLQVAVKNNAGISYFQDTIPATAFLVESGKLDEQTFLAVWQSIPDDVEHSININTSANIEAVKAKLHAANIFYVAKHGQTNFYFSSKVNFNNDEVIVLYEVVVAGNQTVSFCTRTSEPALISLIEQDIQYLLTH